MARSTEKEVWMLGVSGARLALAYAVLCWVPLLEKEPENAVLARVLAFHSLLAGWIGTVA